MPQVLKIAEEQLNEAMNGISPKNRELLRTMLDKIFTNIEQK